MNTKTQEKTHKQLDKLLLEGTVIVAENECKEFEKLLEEIGEKENVEKKENQYCFKSKKTTKKIEYCQEGDFFI